MVRFIPIPRRVVCNDRDVDAAERNEARSARDRVLHPILRCSDVVIRRHGERCRCLVCGRIDRYAGGRSATRRISAIRTNLGRPAGGRLHRHREGLRRARVIRVCQFTRHVDRRSGARRKRVSHRRTDDAARVIDRCTGREKRLCRKVVIVVGRLDAVVRARRGVSDVGVVRYRPGVE